MNVTVSPVRSATCPIQLTSPATREGSSLRNKPDGATSKILPPPATTADLLAHSLVGVPDDEIDKITHLNAMKIYQFDPFKIRPREQCTVGALKAEGADADVSIQSMGRPKGTPFTARQLAELAAGAKK